MTIPELIKLMFETKEQAHKSIEFGIRTDPRDLEVGTELECSRDLFEYPDEYDAPEFLAGTCATGFPYLNYDPEDKADIADVEKTLKINSEYGHPGAHQYLVAGRMEGYGDDNAEVILSSCFVVAKLK